jgi:hypothetical protein
VALKAGQLPATTLHPGQLVALVDTPGQTAQSSTATVGAAPASMDGTVVRVGAPDTQGVTTVDVAVPAASALTLAAWVQTGNVALILRYGPGAGS